MELTTSTFILEIVNFVILVWILKRFLYLPILKAIQTRKEAIQNTLAAAEQTRKGAVALSEKYEGRLREWEKEKEAGRAEFKKEVEQERTRAFAALDVSLKAEREKARATEQRRFAELLEKQEEQATEQALKFISRLLERFASPELEGSLINAFLEDLRNIPSAKLREWSVRLKSQPIEAQVLTAFTLTKELEGKLTARLTEALGQSLTLKFERDPSLMAGVRVNAGLLILHADLRDELASFSGALHG